MAGRRSQKELIEESQRRSAEWAPLLNQARTQFRTVTTVESKLRKNQYEDLKFRASQQWDQATITDRASDQRPYLTVNRLPQFIRQVVNQMRSQGLAIKVSPEGDGASVDTSHVLMGLIRNVEKLSDAQTVYITAAEHQVTIGRGYWRIDAEYVNDDSFQQELRIRRIRNPFSVYMDPTAEALDSRDARFAFIVDDIPKDEYKDRFGNASFASLEAFVATGNMAPQWMPEGRVRTAQWWYTRPASDDLLLVKIHDGTPDGRTVQVRHSQFRTWHKEAQKDAEVVKRRTIETRKVYVARINACQILEGNEDLTAGREWPGRWIPIIPVVGDEIDMNGEVDYRGMVRDAKDPQQLYNYEVTSLAETLALAPRAPFIGWAGMFEGYEDKWRQANRRNFAYLEVNWKDVDSDKPYPSLPQRNAVEAPVMGIVQAIRQADGDLKAMMGLYEPSLGEPQSSKSGKAIMALQSQGQQANSNFTDNLARALRTTGYMLLDLFPSYYDVPHVRSIVMPDGKDAKVILHAGASKAQLPDKVAEGIKGIYDLNVGRHDVQVSAAPSLATRRLETLQGLTAIVQAAPQYLPLLGDLIVGEMDWEKADQAAIRLKTLLPPNLQDPNDPNTKPQLPPQVQQQMQQMQQQLQQLGQALGKATDENVRKLHETNVKALLEREGFQSNERIAILRAKADILVGQMKNAVLADAARLKAQVDTTLAQLDHFAAVAMAKEDAADAGAEAQPASGTPPPAPAAPGPQAPAPGGVPAQPSMPAAPAPPAGPAAPPDMASLGQGLRPDNAFGTMPQQ